MYGRPETEIIYSSYVYHGVFDVRVHENPVQSFVYQTAIAVYKVESTRRCSNAFDVLSILLCTHLYRS